MRAASRLTRDAAETSEMAKNLLLESWADLDSHELRLLLNQRIGGTGQFDGQDANPNRFYLPLARESCRVALTFRGNKIVAVEPGRRSTLPNGRRLPMK